MTDHDWAARIIDPEAFEVWDANKFFDEEDGTELHLMTAQMHARIELARTKAKAVVETERDRCAQIADAYRENAEKINEAPGRDAACMMIARDIRNPSEQT
jgi:hypothetical protein